MTFSQAVCGRWRDCSRLVSCPPSQSTSLPAFLTHVFLGRPQDLPCNFAFSSPLTQITAQRWLPAGSEHLARQQAGLPWVSLCWWCSLAAPQTCVDSPAARGACLPLESFDLCVPGNQLS